MLQFHCLKVNTMKILVLVSNEKKLGNTEKIVRSFLRGANTVKNEITYISLADLSIKSCIDCNSCESLSKSYCVHTDDMEIIFQEIEKNDCIVFATPVYFNFFSGKMKMMIDRFHAIGKRAGYQYPKKKYIILATAAGDKSAFCLMKKFCEEIFTEHMRWEEIIFFGVGNCRVNDDFSDKENQLKKIEKIGKEIEESK